MPQTDNRADEEPEPEGYGLDAAVAAGVTGKLRKHLAEERHVIKAPPSTYAYQASHLRFSAKQGTHEQKVAFAEFSQLVNRIPEASASGWKHSGYLWDVYGAVLRAKLARNELDPDEAESYRKARSYLFTPERDGRVEPSVAYQDYRTFRDAYFKADLAYRQAKQAAENSTDPAVKKRWKDEGERLLGAAREASMTDWTVKGHKDRVEEALRVITSLGSRTPALEWRRFGQHFDPERPGDWYTAPNQSKYAPSPFAPSDATDADWPRTRVSRGELLGLLKDGGSQGWAGIDPQQVDPRITGFAFDHCQVDVQRPWFEQPLTMFGSRAWKFWNPDEEPLSDGGSPPKGRCPGFVESVSLVRNITVFRAPRVPGQQYTAPVATVSELPVSPAPRPLMEEESDVLHVGKMSWQLNHAISLETGRYEPWDQGPATAWADLWFFAFGAFFTFQPLTGTVGWQLLPEDIPYADIGYRDLKKLDYRNEQFKRLPISGPSGIAVRTRNGRFAKLAWYLPNKFGMPVWWTTYTPVDGESTAPETVYLAALKCRVLPKSPNPDTKFPWD
ncbi:hypothetical protein ACFQ7J_25850 [Streptomyces sp. NPDC056501]|uniref:hypothetical protein n=1 Tax=Streptomyces sp. NPDC056501 TaxID=3345841 RepID=UPI003674103A